MMFSQSLAASLERLKQMLTQGPVLGTILRLNPEDAYKRIAVGRFVTRLGPPAMPGCTLLPGV
jgi:hypothetical protein